MDYIFLQHYWWAIISLLGALLVFLLFVQGGQSLMGSVARNDAERSMVVNVLGRKWELTFTTLVTFGGAFFASFPLFYSTSFGGAYYVWMLILIVFVIQAVSYEYRSKAGNILGRKGYDAFLIINGLAAPFLLGAAVGTMFTGAPFTVDFARMGSYVAGDNIISQWATPWHGLDALTDARNIAMGFAVLFLSRSLGALYFINTIDDEQIVSRSRKVLWINAPAFVVFFLFFLFSAVDLHMLINPLYGSLLAVGVVLVLLGFAKAIWGKSPRGAIWFTGIGVVVTVWSLLVYLGYFGSYYPSTVDAGSSLTIFNSSSSDFTLRTMAWVSLGIPFVVGYIWWAWRAMNRKRMDRAEIEQTNEHFY